MPRSRQNQPVRTAVSDSERSQAREVAQKLAVTEMQAMAASTENEYLRESLTEMVIRMDDVGWQSMDSHGAEKEHGMTLSELKTVTAKTRPLISANPQVRKGVTARIGYVWGDGVKYDAGSTESKTKLDKILEANDDLIFCNQANEELEKALASDGNVFLLAHKRSGLIMRIPLSQISDLISSPFSDEDTWYVERSWNVVTQDADGKRTTKQHKEVYPTIRRATLRPLAVWGPVLEKVDGVEVSKDWAVYHVVVNRQIGWPLGVPDVLSAMQWARAYREFLESSFSIVRSLAKFVWKVTQPNVKAANRSAAKLATPTHEANNVAIGGGGDVTALNRASATPDFSAADPLAAMVANGLDVQLITLLAQDEPEQALPVTVLKAMQARQKVWDKAFTVILSYLGIKKPTVTFRPITAGALHRVLQAIVIAANTGTLHPEEVRQVVVTALESIGLEADVEKLPEAGEWSEFVKGITDTAGRNENENPGTQPIDTPNPADGGSPQDIGKGDNELKNDAEK